jgi:hypothetical protein
MDVSGSVRAVDGQMVIHDVILSFLQKVSVSELMCADIPRFMQQRNANHPQVGNAVPAGVGQTGSVVVSLSFGPMVSVV